MRLITNRDHYDPFANVGNAGTGETDCDQDLMTCVLLADASEEQLLEEDAFERIQLVTCKCSSCNRPILVGRFESIAWADRCIDCQQLNRLGLVE